MTKKISTKILVYTSIAYGVTWSIAFLISFLFKQGKLDNYQINLYHSFAAIGPALAAFISAYVFYGKAGVIKLLSRINLQTVDKKTIFFIVSPLLFFIIGYFVFAIIKSRWYDFTSLNFTSFNSLIIWFLPLLSYSIFEEIGWRGFLLPHLQEKYNAWRATGLLTILWALWHIPFFFYRFHFSIGISIGFFLGIFVGSLILTSIYNSSHGFLIPVMLFHFLNNLCSAFDKEIIVAVLSSGFVFTAVFIYKKWGRENLSQINRTQNYFIK